MEYEINGKIYEFKFDIGFLKAVNTRTVQAIQGLDGFTLNMGLYASLYKIEAGDMDELCSLLLLANARTKDKLTRAQLEDFVSSDECDLDDLITKTHEALAKSNATKKTVKMIQTEMNKATA